MLPHLYFVFFRIWKPSNWFLFLGTAFFLPYAVVTSDHFITYARKVKCVKPIATVLFSLHAICWRENSVTLCLSLHFFENWRKHNVKLHCDEACVLHGHVTLVIVERKRHVTSSWRRVLETGWEILQTRRAFPRVLVLSAGRCI